MRQSLIAAVTLVYIAISSAVSFVAAQETVVARRAFEDSKSQHQSEVRRLALDAIGQIMPSLTRFAERQDSENLNKYIKMLALFSKSVDYPARLIPSPSVAEQFSNKRKESARKVYDAYKAAGGIPLAEPSNDPRLVELQSEIKKFIEQERMLQSLAENDGTALEGLDPGMDEENDARAQLEPEANAPKDDPTDEKDVKGTWTIFKAYGELAEEICSEIDEQGTSVLRGKALANSQKRLINFWKNKQLTFECEVVDLSENGRGYALSFSYDGDSDEAATLPTNLITEVYLQALDLKVEDVKPGKRFTMVVTVSASLDGFSDRSTLVTLNTRTGLQGYPPGINFQRDQRKDIGFHLRIQRFSIIWH